MATTLYLTDDPTGTTDLSPPSLGDKHLKTVRGAGVTQESITLSSSGNHILGANSWQYRVNAVTISGTISINWWGNESAMTANAKFAVRISRYDSAGAFVSDVVADSNAAHGDDVEASTTNSAHTWTITPTSTAFSAGDYIRVMWHADAAGTMGTGSLVLRYAGTSASADGDSFVTFNETIEAYTPAADRVPYATPYPQLLPH